MFGELPTPIFPNVLSMRLQPDEGLRLHIMTKEPGPGGFRLHDIPLDMAFAERQDAGWRMPDAYERLLMDVVRGDQTLFMRGDEVEAAWLDRPDYRRMEIIRQQTGRLRTQQFGADFRD